jgi:hypothetical protein
MMDARGGDTAGGHDGEASMASTFVAVAIWLFASFAAGAALETVGAVVLDIHRTPTQGGLWMPPPGLAQAEARRISVRTRDGVPGPDLADARRPSWPAR